MSIVIEFFLVCSKIIKLEDLIQICKHIDQSIIAKIDCIDDWQWNNKRVLYSDKDFERALLNGKICVVSIKPKTFNNAGIYIEKQGDNFEYNMWINTNTFLETDKNKIDFDNKAIYNHFYNIFARIVKKYKIKFRVFAIGVEAMFFYDTSFYEMIRHSHNIVSWIIPDNLLNLMPCGKCFKAKKLRNINATILERWQ